jgi:hypothetical protein
MRKPKLGATLVDIRAALHQHHLAQEQLRQTLRVTKALAERVQCMRLEEFANPQRRYPSQDRPKSGR